jgi:TolA-binding protein
MPFIYKPSPLGKRLPKKAEELIERFEMYRAWERRRTLGKNRNWKPVDVVLSDETKTMQLRPIQMTDEELEEQLKKIDRQLEEIGDAMAEYECSASEVETKQERSERCKKFGELQTTRNVLRQHQAVVSKALREHTRELVPTMKVLGEYGNKEVTLYINNIGSDPYAYAMTYVHEMVHAYLDEGSSVVPEVEEPIVEFATLKFLEIFGNKDLYQYACNVVKNKQYAFGMAYYGFGAYLNETTRSTFLDDYREAKASIPGDPNLPEYMKFWEKGDYPFGEEDQCKNALF